jgi:hypothetical protein
VLNECCCCPQDRDDDDGLEQYVRRCFSRNDISFFPVDHAMSLEAMCVPPLAIVVKPRSRLGDELVVVFKRSPSVHQSSIWVLLPNFFYQATALARVE